MLIPIRWNYDGTMVIKCCVDEEGIKENDAGINPY
jgi:hypothetical protein